jgi:hypothetical protein
MVDLECHLILPDMHVPYENKRAMASIHHYIRWRKRQGRPIIGITQLGDATETEAVSRHNEGKRGLQEGKRLVKEFEATEKYWALWRQLLGPKGKLTGLEGNHEHRVKLYLERNPELEGLLDIPTMLNLKKHNVKWVENWTDKSNLHKIGHAYFGHGFKVNEYHAGGHIKVYHANFFYGHTHAVQSHTLALVAKNKVIEATSCGWLGDRDKSKWMKGNSDKWENAFLVFYVHPTTGMYQHFIVRIFNGGFVSPEGVRFNWKGVVG